MANPILHIKDSYYFEIPKSIAPVTFGSKSDFTGSYETWLRLDPDFQLWEADHFYERYAALKDRPEPKAELLHQYTEWKHSHANAGKPFWRFISEQHDKDWYESSLKSNPSFKPKWNDAIEATSGSQALAEYRTSPGEWSTEKLNAYSGHLSGKILIPQPFGRLRNFYEKEWGFCISKFMIIEVGVVLVLWAVFSWLAQKIETGERPRGAWWNLLETFVMFVRDEIARPVIGHEPHTLVAHDTAVAQSHGAQSHGAQSHGAQSHGAQSHGAQSHGVTAAHDPSHGPSKPSPAEHGHETPGHAEHGHAEHGHAEHGHGEDVSHGEHGHDPRFDADRFVPLLLTIFFFVLGCNLSGMIPGLGSPTGVWGTTSAIAIVTFATGLIYGMRRFGLIGYFLNQIPGMELPWYAAILLKPMIFAIEILGLLIKHTVLSIRLLANMLAGHMVLVSIMALAFSVEGAASSSWSIAAPVSILGCTLLSCLELFVAFLQAYIFTFLSAMFIGAAIHHH